MKHGIIKEMLTLGKIIGGMEWRNYNAQHEQQF